MKQSFLIEGAEKRVIIQITNWAARWLLVRQGLGISNTKGQTNTKPNRRKEQTKPPPTQNQRRTRTGEKGKRNHRSPKTNTEREPAKGENETAAQDK